MRARGDLPSSGRPPASVAKLPATPGVYRFHGAREVLYVGRAVNMRRRVRSYWTDLGDREHLEPMLRQVRWIEAVECDSPHEAAWLERNLLERRLPRWNLVYGQEVAVHISLNLSKARLEVVHGLAVEDEANRFGPYLGSARVRDLVHALTRTYPLDRDRLRGSARDLARVRDGGAAPDRDPALEVAAVLRREPDAVRRFEDALLRQREAAAAVLAFELAGRIQAEIRAAQWLLADQKVTRHGGGDFDAYAWEGGTLVRFRFLDGRLCDWRWSSAEFAAARSLVARTPPGWSEFIGRNARLAAALR